MKTGFGPYFLMLVWLLLFSAHAAGQHFIAVQSTDNLGFTVSLNGTNIGAAKNGLMRISNLSAGAYKLLISFAANKYPPQIFNCTVAKDDESYALKNMGQTGWVLRNTKSGQVIAPTNSLWDDETEGRAPPGFNAFGQMLAQVANDSDLLKPTVWVYSNKIDGAAAGDTTPEIQDGQDTGALNMATRGVIKVSEEDTTGGKKLVFYDFNASGGDTIHLTIPTTDVAGGPAHDSSGLAQNNANANSARAKMKAGAQDIAAASGDDGSLLGRGHREKIDTTIALDTSANKQFKNPFYKNDTAAVNSRDMHFTDTSVQNTATAATVQPQVTDTAAGLVNKTVAPADTTLQKPLAGMLVDTVVQKASGSAITIMPDTSAQKLAGALAIKPAVDTAAAKTGTQTSVMPADTSQQKPAVAIQTEPNSSAQKQTGDANPPAVLTRADCKKMLNESALDKLKHKIYLETDESRMVDIAKKYLDGKCIITDQVKILASYFITDDARLNFFKAVYPFVYDYGNFGSLETFMIDKNYKEQFQAMLK